MPTPAPDQPVLVGLGTDRPPAVRGPSDGQVVGGSPHPDEGGWYVTDTGRVEAYGSAAHHGDMADVALNEPIVAMEATPSGGGYWLVAADGGIFAFGDAGFWGSAGHLVLNRPIVDLAALPSGKGYYLVADDGGVFAFGDARFMGSMGAVNLNQPIVGMGVTPTGGGYHLVARDGGVFAFGDAPFLGSTGHRPPPASVVDLVPQPGDAGYWLVTEAGESLAFGSAPDLGSVDSGIHGLVVGASPHRDGLWLTVHPTTPRMMVWRSGGLDASAAAEILAMADQHGAPAVTTHVGTIGLLQVWRDRILVQGTTPGFQVGLSARAVDAASFADFARPDVAAALRKGEVVMSRASADLREARVGDRIVIEGWDGTIQRRTIGAVVPDQLIGWSEIVFDAADAARFGFDRPGSVWISGLIDPVALGAIQTDLVQLSLDDPWLAWARSWDPPGLDGVLSTIKLKQRLGEFQYRLGDGVAVDIDPAWVAANIVTVDLPILGRWRCHRVVVPDLVAVLEELIARGLEHHIDPADSRYGGCWVARRIRGSSGGALSRHAWGVAVDLNPSTNPWGAEPTMAPEVVDVFRSHGFAWGGTWARPDGMHFEWTGGT